jgi:hypothetical protein
LSYSRYSLPFKVDVKNKINLNDEEYKMNITKIATQIMLNQYLGLAKIREGFVIPLSKLNIFFIKLI